MPDPVVLQGPAEYDGRDTLADVIGFEPQWLATHGVDEHWHLPGEGGQSKARWSLWWRNVPAIADQRVGLIGHYAARDADAARNALDSACQSLRAHGCTLAIGPMDGSTWRKYRLVTDFGDEPPFFLEPVTPVDWPHHFEACGFSPLAEYYSALVSPLPRSDERIAKARDRIEKAGIGVRALDMSRFDDELREIYDVSSVGFCDNFLYSSISEAEFMTGYSQIRPHLHPELVLLAQHGHRLVGFLFALPDLNQARRGQPLDTIILKSIAVRPEFRGLGLGAYLMGRCQEIAAELGFRRAIHALMSADNLSLRISRHYGQVMRRYTLFARPLNT